MQKTSKPALMYLKNVFRKWITSLLLLFLLLSTNVTAQEVVQTTEAEMPTGEQLPAQLFLILLIMFFVMIKLLSDDKLKLKKKKEAEEEEEVTFLDVILQSVGKLKPISDHTFMGSKLIHSEGGIETYLTVTQVDKSHLQRQAIAKISKNSSNYSTVITVLVIIIVVLLVLLQL